MVGDNLSTDIRFANSCGIDSLLVLSGVTNASKASKILEQK
jgi:ribonucleotide monophosphatase NagD (HAD superfamily)